MGAKLVIFTFVYMFSAVVLADFGFDNTLANPNTALKSEYDVYTFQAITAPLVLKQGEGKIFEVSLSPEVVEKIKNKYLNDTEILGSVTFQGEILGGVPAYNADGSYNKDFIVYSVPLYVRSAIDPTSDIGSFTSITRRIESKWRETDGPPTAKIVQLRGFLSNDLAGNVYRFKVNFPSRLSEDEKPLAVPPISISKMEVKLWISK